MNKTKNLTEGNIYKNFFLFAIPLVLAQLLSLSYNTFDSMIAGKYISNLALGAVGATYMFDLFLILIFGGFSVGFSIYISRLFGEKDYVKIKSAIVNVLAFIVCCAIILSVLCLIFNKQIIGIFKVDDEIKQDVGNGTRLYFGNEFKRSGRHITDSSLSLSMPKGRTEYKIIENNGGQAVYDADDNNKLAKKADFAEAVRAERITISDSSWQNYLPLFKTIRLITKQDNSCKANGK